ncbi:BMC domain protein [Sporomusa termitida]|uniref:BMC domain protein n=2 Tax=Sporomusa termitida TaxID=2377 RepID=A0A517DYK1_9FIRM|nr:BMC domain protein [Sporomusa termitida]
MQALGLIETRGLLPAIEGADVMLKTAQVELLGRTLVGGGLVTIAVTGDVGAVKAAVAAGIAAVAKIGHLSLVAQHVIPRPHPDIDSMVVVSAKPAAEHPIPGTQPETAGSLPGSEPTPDINGLLPNQDTATGPAEPVLSTPESLSSGPIALKELHKEGVDDFVRQFGLEQSVNALRTFSVVKLRHLARGYNELGIAGRAITKANKDLLIQKLKGYYEKGREK